MDERDAVKDVNDDPDEDEGEDLFAEEFEECVSSLFLETPCFEYRRLFNGAHLAQHGGTLHLSSLFEYSNNFVKSY